MDNRVLLSVIIPTFNRHKRLKTLLDLLSQSITTNQLTGIVEIIIVDDASTPTISLPETPIKISLERNNKNSGAPYSREKGFKISKGKFIHFHDSDDSITKEWLPQLIYALKTKPTTDILLTGRIDHRKSGDTKTYKRFFHKNSHSPQKIAKRLLYWNCIGPIGGVVFSRQILEKIPFKHFSSSQDWQMYLSAMEHAHVLNSQPEIQFIFNKTGQDRISHNPRKKILGFLQYAQLTEKKSIFKRSIRLFYLYRCRQHINQHGGQVKRFYHKHRLRILFTYLIIAGYSFLTNF